MHQCVNACRLSINVYVTHNYNVSVKYIDSAKYAYNLRRQTDNLILTLQAFIHFQYSFRFIPKDGQITCSCKISTTYVCIHIKISFTCCTDNKCRYQSV